MTVFGFYVNLSYAFVVFWVVAVGLTSWLSEKEEKKEKAWKASPEGRESAKARRIRRSIENADDELRAVTDFLDRSRRR